MWLVVAYFLLLSGLTVVVVGLVVYQRATRDLTDSAFLRLEAVSDLKADALDRWLDEQRRNVVFIAQIPGVGDAAARLLTAETDPVSETIARDSVTRTLETAVDQAADIDEILLRTPD